MAGNPIKYRGEIEASHIYPPKLGEHSREVLRGLLDLNDTELEKYFKNGIIFETDNQKEIF